MNQLSVKVTKKIREAEDIFSFELASNDGQPLPPFSAGSHIDVRIRDGLVRQYSLCNDPSENHRYLIGVLRDPNSRGGSIAMHDHIAEGDVLAISEPKNHFPLTNAPHSLLLAGGIGVTPILCMAERLAAIGASFEMHYCTRAPERTAFRHRIEHAAFSEKVAFYFDGGLQARKIDLPGILAQCTADTHLYVCGPTGFIDFVLAAAKSNGWPSERLHLEYFGAAPIDTSGDDAFEIKIASSGRIIKVPAGLPVTEALARNGIEIPISCEQGVCGTCITRVLEGVPDHRDMYFTDEEKARNDQFTPCCSRAKSRQLVLDI